MDLSIASHKANAREGSATVNYLGDAVKQFQRRLSRLNAGLERLLQTMEQHSERELSRSPVPGAWTPLQTLHHLYLAERASLDYLLYKRREQTDVPRSNIAARLRGQLVRASLLSPLKFKAPATTDSQRVESAKDLTVETLAYDFRELRRQLGVFFHDLPTGWARGAVYKHPVAGRLTLRDMLGFFIVHQRRHAQQITRALAQNARDHSRQKAR